ncbi:hypothetical protein OG453_40480 [Streptomyces sp. NBC_01381]|uniref:hypothetical protein n=1 Tax=Streptomyces sp. NBC_01381 TaxID=2903845 RepID=UPI00224D9846|nr:hypothetical protein [Streptomyces sp. NBC_01381]MCX4672849.1 hypothetical protein [Streptomyces sp. NBC_01381]
MKTATLTAHLEADTPTRLSIFGDRPHEAFVSLRIGGGLIDISLIAVPGTADALRDLATQATQAAQVLDDMAKDPAAVTA